MYKGHKEVSIIYIKKKKKNVKQLNNKIKCLTKISFYEENNNENKKEVWNLQD